MRIRSIVLSFMIVMSTVAAASCKGGDDDGEGGNLPACPSGGTKLTYDTFGKKFFSDYCNGCHSDGAGVSGAEPFDTQAQIQDEAEDIYGRAGGTNTNMPQSGAKPSDAERQQLAEWLSCGAK